VASLWYYTSIRGLISVSGLGKIEAVNNNFSLATLGYRTDELTAMVRNMTTWRERQASQRCCKAAFFPIQT